MGITRFGDLGRKTLTVEDAKRIAAKWPGCKGFCFRGPMTDEPVEIIFKSKFDNGTSENRWTSFTLEECKAQAEKRQEENFIARDDVRWTMYHMVAHVRFGALSECKRALQRLERVAD